MEETADSGATGAFGKTWEVHKFGGTSVASAECYLKVAAIVEEQLGFGDDDDGTAPTKCLAVVVSAMGGFLHAPPYKMQPQSISRSDL